MDLSTQQVTWCALDAQGAERELSRLEACVIAQHLGAPVSAWDIYYSPRSQSAAISDGIAEHYAHARWDERVAWDMLGTYALNTPDI